MYDRSRHGGRGRTSSPRIRFGNTATFDPFLLLDDFETTGPQVLLVSMASHAGSKQSTYVLQALSNMATVLEIRCHFCRRISNG